MSGLLALEANRRTIRGPINPYDKSTVFSILPKKIVETKPTIMPGVFELKPGSYEKPSILVVGPSSWWREIDENQPLIEIPTSSIQVADSIVNDYINGLVGCDMHEKRPGLFYLPGEWTVEKLRKEQMPMLERAKQYQRNWFQELVKIADIMWARTNGNPLSISDDARLACKELGIHDKAWLKDYQTVQMVKCKACGSLKNPDFPVCATCRAVDNPELAKTLGIQFVNQ